MHNEPVGKQKLIEPIIINDDIYLQNWLNADYKTNAYHHEECVYDTRQGELVRSKSEAMLADMYFNLGIPTDMNVALILVLTKQSIPISHC